MNQLQSSFSKSVRGGARWIVAVIFLATLFVLLDTNAAHAQNVTRTWYLDNVRFESGAVATGSFDYNTEPNNPLAGQYGTYSNININVTDPDGTVREFRIVNPASGGNDRYISVVAAIGGDLTGAPFMALTPAINMTNAGGVINILPGPQDLSYIGVCRNANCGPADPPYEEALAGGRIIAGPQTWHLDNVRFDSGAVANGSFVYDQEPYNPLAGQYGTYSNINIDVTNPDGSVRKFRIVNPASRGNDRYVSVVAATGGDLTGAPFMALTPAISMTNAGGIINILPGPQNLSYLGVCLNSNCGPADAPYEEALAGGRIQSNPGLQRWYLEGVRFDSGAVATGYYDYNEQPYAPLAGQYGTYANINIDVTSPDGTVREFRIVNPASRGNARYVSVVAATGGDLTDAPFMALTPAISMTNVGGPINILPGPQDLSYVGVCRNLNCGPADPPYEEALAGGRIVRVVAPPTISSANTANVPENQTSVIDINATDNLDNEGNGLTFSLSGGADQAQFSIDANTGVVTFNSAPDFEAPTDANTDNAYEIQVTVTDLGGLTDVQNLVISVTDVAENSAPTITSSASTSVAENQPDAIDVQATDDNDAEGAGLTFSLTGGADQALFSIDANTGVVTFNSAPDFDAPADANADNAYEIQVTVADSGGLTTVQEITISVLEIVTWYLEDVQLNSGQSVRGSFEYVAGLNQYLNLNITLGNTGRTFNVLSPNGSNDQSRITLVEASLPNLTGQAALRFQFANALTAARGTVNILTNVPFAGTLSMLGVCQNANCATITTPFDPMSGRVTTVQSPPTITSGNSASVPENQTSAIDVQASDDFDSEGSGLTFSLTGGVDQALFSIDANTGVVTFNSAPDFEAPSDANTDNAYEVQVTVADSGGLSAVQDITISVTDVDETPADTTPPTANPTFDPAANGAGWHNADVAISFNWTDNVGGSGIDPNNCGTTTSITEEGANIGYGSGCADLAGNVGETTGFLLIDKTAPDTSLTSTPSNPSSSGDAIFEFGGSDSLSGIGGFECGIDDGALQVVTPCSSPHNLSALENGTYTFTVSAIDVAGNVDPTPATYTWTVDIPPANVAPTISSAATASVPENQTDAIDVNATDDNDSEGSGLTFTLSGGADQALLSIDANTGVVTFNNAPDFESPADANTDNAYEIQVTVTDSGGLTAVQDITISVTDVDETPDDITAPTNSPQFDPTPNAAGWNNTDILVIWNWSDEIGPNGAPASGIDLDNCIIDNQVTTEGITNLPGQECSDLAGNVAISNGAIVSIDMTAPDTSLTSTPPNPSSSGDAIFEFDGSDTLSGIGGFECLVEDGALQVVTPCSSPHNLSALENGTYTFTVSAIDAAGNVDPTPASYTWTFDVPPANVAPTISSAATVSVAENQTDAIDVQATDDNDSEGAGFTFSLTGGADQAQFSIDANTGVVIFSNAPDFEAPADANTDNAYEIQVTVTDSGGLTAVQDITISVTDVEETLVCEPGSYQAHPSDTSCTLADPGFFVPVAGATEQTPCAAGTFSDLAGATDCTEAAPGFFVPTEGASEATPCALGSYSSESGATACTLADIGFYVDALGSAGQTQCPAGTTTESIGATDISACIPTSTAFANCGGYDVFEISPGVYEAPSFSGNLIVGSNRIDWIRGTNGPDLILGLGGGDAIFGRKGDDVICGGNGKDYVSGATGKDIIFGNDGADWLLGGSDNDELWGGEGRDDLLGLDGDDKLYGENGYDVLLGGKGSDQLFGGDDRDKLYGNRGNDDLDGGAGNDYCQGGPGNDSITKCEGASSATATLDDVEVLDEEAVLGSNDGENAEDAAVNPIQDLFLPLVTNQ